MLFDWETHFDWSFWYGWRLVFESWSNITWIHHLKIARRLHNHRLVILYRVGWRFTNTGILSGHLLLDWRLNDFYIHNNFLWRELVKNPVEAQGSLLSPLKSWQFISAWDVLVIVLIFHLLELGDIERSSHFILSILQWRLASWLRILGSNLSQICDWFRLFHSHPAFPTSGSLLRRFCGGF